MKDRVESSEKTKVTLHLSTVVAGHIHRRSYDTGKTQSKYVEDLVLGEVLVGELDMEGLENTLIEYCRGFISLKAAVADVLSIFGIEKAG